MITLLVLIPASILSVANVVTLIALVRAHREHKRTIEKFAKLWTRPVVEVNDAPFVPTRKEIEAQVQRISEVIDHVVESYPIEDLGRNIAVVKLCAVNRALLGGQPPYLERKAPWESAELGNDEQSCQGGIGSAPQDPDITEIINEAKTKGRV